MYLSENWDTSWKWNWAAVYATLHINHWATKSVPRIGGLDLFKNKTRRQGNVLTYDRDDILIVMA